LHLQWHKQLIRRADLKYRSAPQSLIDDLFGDETFELPIIEMASAEASVKLVD
jgi:hypothetical protein